jgi:hypothetical protein
MGSLLCAWKSTLAAPRPGRTPHGRIARHRRAAGGTPVDGPMPSRPAPPGTSSGQARHVARPCVPPRMRESPASIEDLTVPTARQMAREPCRGASQCQHSVNRAASGLIVGAVPGRRLRAAPNFISHPMRHHGQRARGQGVDAPRGGVAGALQEAMPFERCGCTTSPARSPCPRPRGNPRPCSAVQQQPRSPRRVRRLDRRQSSRSRRIPSPACDPVVIGEGFPGPPGSTAPPPIRRLGRDSGSAAPRDIGE